MGAYFVLQYLVSLDGPSLVLDDNGYSGGHSVYRMCVCVLSHVVYSISWFSFGVSVGNCAISPVDWRGQISLLTGFSYWVSCVFSNARKRCCCCRGLGSLTNGRRLWFSTLNGSLGGLFNSLQRDGPCPTSGNPDQLALISEISSKLLTVLIQRTAYSQYNLANDSNDTYS